MAKRPSIIDDVMLPTPATATSAEIAEEQPVAANKPAVRRAPTPDVHRTSVYLPLAAFERLREIAYTERCKVHDLIMQGVDRVLAERGHSERALRGATALQRDGATK